MSAAPPNPTEKRPNRLADTILQPHGTLARKLTMRTTALVAVVAIALSVVTAWASYQILLHELDQRLQSAISRPALPGRGWQQGATQPRDDVAGSGLIRIDANLANGVVARYLITASPEDLAVVDIVDWLDANLGLVGHGASTIPDPNGEPYRVLIQQGRGIVTLVALPYRAVTDGLTSQILFSGVVTVGVIAVAYLVTRQVVASSLRPLNRLAATATRVSNLPLAQGPGAVPVRVSESDADPNSEVGQVGQAFNHMLDNVEGALAARHRSEMKVRQFVADASHELRNPLASIKGYAELTRRNDQSLSPDAAHALTRIEAEASRMASLVADLLLLARLDSEPTLDLATTDLTSVVLGAVSDARVAGPAHRWTLQVPPDPIQVVGDGSRLTQVIMNLLANARVHTPPGTTVTTTLTGVPGWAVLDVADDGPGVPESVREIIFERFTRADTARSRQPGESSTGLGLAIVAAIVAAHHGHVALISEPGRTTFRVHLPLAPPTQTEARPPQMPA